jgi:uncharacterized protein (TIGR03085 family)
MAGTLLEAGPAAPTLCGDWAARDLLAHLVIRDQRPDAAPGIFLPGWSRWTRQVQERIAHREFAGNVRVIRDGPPWWVPAAHPPTNRVDLLEYVVHHEDVRRAREGWSPRPPEAERDDVLWTILAGAGRSAYLRSPVGVVLRRPDGAQRVVHSGSRHVVLSGEVVDLVLHALGRDRVILERDGDAEDVAAIENLNRGV